MENQKPPVVNPPPPAETTADFIADKIGFLPNVRKSDNVFQAKFVLASSGGGIVLGLIVVRNAPWWAAGTIGLVVGMLLGALVSGTILGIRGLRR